MVNFRSKRPARDKGNGESFLASAKAEHEAVFAQFVEAGDDYQSVEEYTDALQRAAWEVCEQIAKRSYRNGMARARQSGNWR